MLSSMHYLFPLFLSLTTVILQCFMAKLHSVLQSIFTLDTKTKQYLPPSFSLDDYINIKFGRTSSSFGETSVV